MIPIDFFGFRWSSHEILHLPQDDFFLDLSQIDYNSLISRFGHEKITELL